MTEGRNLPFSPSGGEAQEKIRLGPGFCFPSYLDWPGCVLSGSRGHGLWGLPVRASSSRSLSIMDVTPLGIDLRTPLQWQVAPGAMGKAEKQPRSAERKRPTRQPEPTTAVEPWLTERETKA